MRVTACLKDAWKLKFKAPVNGGRNYNGCKSLRNKVLRSYLTKAVVKFGCMLERLDRIHTTEEVITYERR